MSQKLKKFLGNFLKIAISILFLYFVYSKISFKVVLKIISTSNVLFLVFSMLFFIASQLLSANRLMLYFNKLEKKITYKENYILYAIGMFYNFFIPGGIGGDAYKVFYLKKNRGFKVKPTTSALLLDRIIGLVIILVIILLLISFVEEIPSLYKIIALLLIPIGIGLTFFIVHKVWKKYYTIIPKTLLYSFIIQSLQILSIISILYSLNHTEHILFYVLMFLVSSVLGVISFGGIGVREFVFFQMAKYISIDAEVSVSVGLMFTIITAFISLSGLYFHLFEKKYLEKN